MHSRNSSDRCKCNLDWKNFERRIEFESFDHYRPKWNENGSMRHNDSEENSNTKVEPMKWNFDEFEIRAPNDDLSMSPDRFLHDGPMFFLTISTDVDNQVDASNEDRTNKSNAFVDAVMEQIKPIDRFSMFDKDSNDLDLNNSMHLFEFESSLNDVPSITIDLWRIELTIADSVDPGPNEST